ncbi:MFS transporter [Acetobacteraceae bacterium KSS8]|uniref:MFS transporter n=1 Tax=Endosaccharibacter trunci TaxID=2812733 RepID=A0ABT1W2W2_9PROT|nr:MFS transporter [Acetobacteraceae bacterium KSS8]
MSGASLLPAAERPELSQPRAVRRRGLIAACLTHALHDGYTDGLYAFLPVWQVQFGLSYAGLAGLRGLYYATMGGLQIPADRALRGVSPRVALTASSVVASAGLLVMALPFGLASLCIGLVLAGIGSSIQHPRGSMLVADSFGASARRPLGLYNFAGDLGKSALPAAIAVSLPLLSWRPLLGMVAIAGLILAAAVAPLIPHRVAADPSAVAARAGRGKGGFGVLFVIGVLDTATRMGYLLFLPFLVHGRAGGSGAVGLAFALLFVGGAFGKASCAWLGERLGVVGCVIATETATALLIAATLFAPLVPMLILLPLLGVVLNGTSSVLYGSVPELARGDAGQAFAIFYTGVIGSGGVAPILYGMLADHSTRGIGVLASALTAFSIVPLALLLRPFLGGRLPAVAPKRSVTG